MVMVELNAEVKTMLLSLAPGYDPNDFSSFMKAIETNPAAVNLLNEAYESGHLLGFDLEPAYMGMIADYDPDSMRISLSTLNGEYDTISVLSHEVTHAIYKTKYDAEYRGAWDSGRTALLNGNASSIVDLTSQIAAIRDATLKSEALATMMALNVMKEADPINPLHKSSYPSSLLFNADDGSVKNGILLTPDGRIDLSDAAIEYNIDRAAQLMGGTAWYKNSTASALADFCSIAADTPIQVDMSQLVGASGQSFATLVEGVRYLDTWSGSEDRLLGSCTVTDTLSGLTERLIDGDGAMAISHSSPQNGVTDVVVWAPDLSSGHSKMQIPFSVAELDASGHLLRIGFQLPFESDMNYLDYPEIGAGAELIESLVGGTLASLKGGDTVVFQPTLWFSDEGEPTLVFGSEDTATVVLSLEETGGQYQVESTTVGDPTTGKAIQTRYEELDVLSVDRRDGFYLDRKSVV